MPSVDVVATCPVHDSFRVQQVAGMFDLPLADKATEEYSVELPDLDEPWQTGLIVGPSGSGKSTIARHAYAAELFAGADWPAEMAVIDCFGDLPVRQVVELFTAVGFSSPPSWIKPYRVLSGGEQFRCDLARALGGARRGARAVRRQTSREDPNPRLAPHNPRPLSSSTSTPASSTGTSRGPARPRSPREFAAGTFPYGSSL